MISGQYIEDELCILRVQFAIEDGCFAIEKEAGEMVTWIEMGMVLCWKMLFQFAIEGRFFDLKRGLGRMLSG
jgi:hypothetical protein